MKEKIKIQRGFIKIPLLIGIIVFIVVIMGVLKPTTTTTKSTITTTTATVTVPPNSTTTIKPSTTATSPEKITFLVTRVIDGDTIEIEGGNKVRYIGIDTPETVDPRKPIQCFGIEAAKRNKQLVEGKQARLEKDVSETDKYGRLLRYVFVGDTFVNLVLVQEGFAYSYTFPPDVKYQNQFLEAERQAREQKKGLWSACPVSTPTSILTPASLPASSPNTDCTIKGNINSSGEKIYHVKGCDSYNVTKIDEARGEQWFCTEEEAIAAGWRKAKNCP